MSLGGRIKLLMDWSGVEKMKEGLLDALRQTRPGAGITIGGESCKWKLSDPIVARAIIELLKSYPKDIEATDFGFELTLMRKPDMHRSMTKEAYEDQTGRYGILTADGLSKLGMWAKDQLPAHLYRGGFDEETFNDETQAARTTRQAHEYEVREHARDEKRRKKRQLLDAAGVPVTVERDE